MAADGWLAGAFLAANIQRISEPTGVFGFTGIDGLCAAARVGAVCAADRGLGVSGWRVGFYG